MVQQPELAAEGENILCLCPKTVQNQVFSHSSPLPRASGGDGAVGMEFPSECWDFPGAVHGVAMVCIMLMWPQLLPVPPSSSIMVIVLLPSAVFTDPVVTIHTILWSTGCTCGEDPSQCASNKELI